MTVQEQLEFNLMQYKVEEIQTALITQGESILQTQKKQLHIVRQIHKLEKTVSINSKILSSIIGLILGIGIAYLVKLFIQ
tara:strand:+ start:926 stop:1165 length:240 start_codon:yes stop_codon:yes gene_type:complete